MLGQHLEVTNKPVSALAVITDPNRGGSHAFLDVASDLVDRSLRAMAGRLPSGLECSRFWASTVLVFHSGHDPLPVVYWTPISAILDPFRRRSTGDLPLSTAPRPR